MRGTSQWRRRQQRLALSGEMCPACESMIFPPRDVCPHCGGPAKDAYAMCGRGTIYSYSRVIVPPYGYDAYAPYTVALVMLDEGPLVTAQLTDVDYQDVHIGMPVEMVTRVITEEGERGLINYGYKFRPTVWANAVGS
jgi:uncharacterized protein